MNQQPKNNEVEHYLACEHSSVFYLLMMSAGMMGAYTFNLRGGVFCNAQTANLVMMAVALGKRDIIMGLYYLIPIFAYLGGIIISEVLPNPVKRIAHVRWDTYLIGFEIIVLFIIGWLPLSLPHQIVQIAINFICSMQYNTFRQSEGVPMATTFCTNHIRQFGNSTVKYIRKRDSDSLRRIKMHAIMLFVFFLGGLLLTVLCDFIAEKSIWLATVPLLIAFIRLLHADLVEERNLIDEKPHGH
ncbi:MAG: DUF1275 domain-containing protein [Ruminococcus sp.]|nr:DUF1275 domain-containing protein [Ruminococcus sp.]